jgi:serine/threonine protein kinase
MADTTSPPTGLTDVDFVALKTGQTIGRYEIISILGQGGYGITYRARDTQLGREVAIKEYLPSALAVRQDGVTVLPRSTKMAEDFTWGRDRFVSEGQTLASLHGAPAIVHVFDFLEANGTAYIVMELLSGETLEDRLKRDGKLDAEAVDKILWPLLDGLEQVHKAGFLHRDIKPANILLNREGKPTLIDFGASRAAMVGRTTALTAIFTPGYAAAEQMTSARQGPWTDIYGLSATLYHAITGHVPPSAFDRMLDDKYEPLARVAPPGFSRGLCAGIDAGLTVVSISRPQSIAGWRPILGMTSAPDANATVVMGKGDAGKTTPSTTSVAAKKKSVGIWIAAAAILIALLGGGGYYFAAMRGPDPEMVKAQAAAKAAEEARQKAEQEASVLREQQAKAAQAAAETERQKRLEEEARKKAAADLVEQQKAEADRKRADEEAKRKADEEAEAKRKAVEFVAGNFDHFGRTLLLVGLAGRPDEIRLQGVDIVDDAAVRQLGVNALASQPRNLRCRQTDRLTDGTPLYRCLITQLNAKPPIDQIPDTDRVDLALALVRNGLVLASCDAPRTYADAEEARGRGQSLWGRVKVDEYKRRCSR